MRLATDSDKAERSRGGEWKAEQSTLEKNRKEQRENSPAAASGRLQQWKRLSDAVVCTRRGNVCVCSGGLGLVTACDTTVTLTGEAVSKQSKLQFNY